MKSDSSHRLNELLQYFGINQTDFIKKTGIPKSAVSMYLSGQRVPRQDRLSDIAEAYGVSEPWLMGYDVPMTEKPEDKNTSSSFTLSDLEKQIIIAYRKADEFDQTTVLRTLHIDDIEKKESTVAG